MMDEQKRKKIGIIGSVIIHVFVFLFISLTGLLNFTSLSKADIVEITTFDSGGGNNGGGGRSEASGDLQETSDSEPVASTPEQILPDAILQHSDNAKADITYEQLEQLKEKMEKEEVTNTPEVSKITNTNTSTQMSVNHDNDAKSTTVGNGTGTADGTAGTGFGDGNGQDSGEGTGEGTGSGTGDGDGDGSGYGEGDSNEISANPAVPPRLIKSRQPNYPEKERNAGVEGTTVIRFLVSNDGSIESIEVASSSGSAALDEAAVNAGYKWKFSPAKNDAGRAVRCYVSVPIAFHIKN